MERLLLAGAFAVVAVFVISTAITVIAPYLAILIVGAVIYKLAERKMPNDQQEPPE